VREIIFKENVITYLKTVLFTTAISLAAGLLDSDNRIDNNAIVVPSSSGAITTVSCPIGTTAKPDMTCHVTG